MPNPPMRLNPVERQIILDYRERNKALSEECERAGLPIDEVNIYWYKSKMWSIQGKKNRVSFETIRKDLIKELDAYSPKFKKIKREKSKDAHLLVLDPADVHLGKFASAFEAGKQYDHNIAVQRVMEGVQGIINKSSGYNIDKILFIAGNDILHIDDPKRRSTTSGTTQDVSCMWYDSFLFAKDLYVDVIETLLPMADIHFLYCPSNHDYMSGFMLADTIRSWFRKHPNMTFDVSIKHRKYFKYFDNLIGATHGDGGKNADLPLSMAEEVPKLWGDSKWRYIYTHHQHHKVSKDYHTVTVESVRSPSGTDSWHHRNQYLSKKSIEGFIHHKTDGQVARFNHYF